MPQLIQLNSFHSEKGDLTVIENLLPGSIKRAYYIQSVPTGILRGGHRHHKTWQVLVCIKGSCSVYVDDNIQKQNFILDTPDKGLLLEPQDWHTMQDFSSDAILLVLANEPYDVTDYIDEPYQ